MELLLVQTIVILIVVDFVFHNVRLDAHLVVGVQEDVHLVLHALHVLDAHLAQDVLAVVLHVQAVLEDVLHVQAAQEVVVDAADVLDVYLVQAVEVELQVDVVLAMVVELVVVVVLDVLVHVTTVKNKEIKENKNENFLQRSR